MGNKLSSQKPKPQESKYQSDIVLKNGIGSISYDILLFKDLILSPPISLPILN